MIFDHSTNAENGIYIDQLPATKRKIDIAWHCKKCGHKWNSLLKVMIPSGFKCPCCETGKVIVKGINDVLTVVPGLKDYYDFEKNKDYDIFSKGVSCTDTVYWTCPECKRSWRSSICSRVTGTKGNYSVVPCPHYNTEKRRASDIQFIAQVPDIHKFWDYSKNTLDPTITPINSPVSVFWKCNHCGHEWESAVYIREQSTHKCPICELGLKVTPY